MPSLEGGPSKEEDRNVPTACESCAATKCGWVPLCQTGCGKQLRTPTQCGIGHCLADGKGCRLAKTCNQILENGLECGKPCVPNCLKCKDCRAKTCNQILENGLECGKPCVSTYLKCKDCRAKTCNQILKNGSKCGKRSGDSLKCKDCRATEARRV